ncbi:hypothetical protein SSX86_006082 [Deinandra increscens subsp. villosa]|uniref:Mediator complex subunit 15 KIX domain-containing protein n=1 Tax=Deinandra increscens subsp. villosa TaxID=3103831 RepID=A0AAP0HCH6_9ASTR
MDTSNGRPTRGACGAVDDPTMVSCNWRDQPQRRRIVNKIMDTLKKNLPFSRHERLQELKKIAERVEDEIYTAATSQSEYSRKICFMMLTIETRLQTPLVDSVKSNSAASYNSLHHSIPFDSIARIDNPNGRDWQQEVYQKIKAMKDLYLLDLRRIQDARDSVADPIMASVDWRATQSAGGAIGDPILESVDWKAQLQAESRQRIVNKILETLKRHLPFSGPEGLQELMKIALTFEEKIYSTATSQSDYLRKISLKMLTMETRPQNPMSDPIMASVDWRPTQSAGGAIGDPILESVDWRVQLKVDSRPRIVNKILDTLKRHLPFSGPEGLQELMNIASMFEEKIYTTATSQSDYLRKISLKMLTVETRPQNPMSDPIMASFDWSPTQSAGGAIGDPILESVDWKAQLQAESRQRIVNKILETLKRHLPFSGPEGLQELMKIALTFEEKIYSTATSQSDYLRKISLKMLTMETRPQNPMSDPIMASVDWRPTQSAGGAIGDPILESVDWRVQLKVDSRPRIVNKILDTLKRHLPFSGPEGLQELMNIASMFEEKIYTTATSQSDYLRKISLKMLTVETRPQNPMSDPIMASFDWSPTQSAGGAIGGDPILESVDWRAHLHADSRQRIVNKILDTLKRHLPFSGTDGLQELMNIALRFEEKIYTAATSQSDYLREISLKMLAVETRSQNPMSDPMQSNYAASSVNP